jgi:Glycosyl transferase family 2
MTPEVSVIIPTYNRRAMLLEAIDSVFAQTTEAFELIVIDDGSTDGTSEHLMRLGKTIRIERIERSGPAAARNCGVELARAPLIAFLDSDDLWAPAKLERQLAFMRANPSCAISQTDEIWIRNGRRVNPGLRHRKRAGDIFIDSLRTCLISMSATMMRTDLFRSIGGFDEIMMAAEDYDLWLRILIDHEAGLLDEPLVTRRGGHCDQTSATTPAIDRFRILALAKCSPRNATSTRAASRVEAESIRLVSTSGSLTRRKTGEMLRSVALSNPSDRRFTKFHMNADEIDAQIREIAAERRLPQSHLDRWLAMDPRSRAAMLELARILRLRTGQLVTALDTLDEIAVREHVTVAAILERPEVRRIAKGSGSAPSRASALLEALRTLRYPRLKKTQDELRAEVTALKLPRGISIDLPKELGSDELSVSLRVRSGAELAHLLDALDRSRSGLTRIIEMLGGKK